jgi:hypothetical protein
MIRAGAIVAGVSLWFASQSPRQIGAAQHDAEQFSVALTTDNAYRSGQEGAFVVTLTPKSGFKVNPQFPTRFKVDTDADGSVKFPKPVMKKEDGTFSESAGSFRVPFVPSKAGKATLKGTLSLSVCSDKTCVMEKVTVDALAEVR